MQFSYSKLLVYEGELGCNYNEVCVVETMSSKYEKGQGYVCMLGALLVHDDGIRKNSAWETLGQSHGFMPP